MGETVLDVVGWLAAKQPKQCQRLSLLSVVLFCFVGLLGYVHRAFGNKACTLLRLLSKAPSHSLGSCCCDSKFNK